MPIMVKIKVKIKVQVCDKARKGVKVWLGGSRALPALQAPGKRVIIPETT